MTHTQYEALKLALKALEFFKGLALSIEEIERAEEAITALQSIINQDALHKMAEESRTSGLRLDDWDKIVCVNHDCDKCKAQPAPTVQEPVAKYIGECSDGSLVQLYEDVKKGTDFYTTPPEQPAPVPLTDAVLQKVISNLEPLLDAKNQSWAAAEKMLHGITEKGQP
jgi:hypothetical protein